MTPLPYQFLIFLYLIVTITNSLSSEILVTLSNGIIRGRSDKTLTGNQFYAFQGIPYAAPPVGELRFKAPTVAKSWQGIRNATSLDVICHQQIANPSIQVIDPTRQSEDCLYLNVYTPKLQNNKNNVSIPVLLYIHGGYFMAGHSMQYRYGPEYLLDYGIIVVTINYRLGVFGFLSSGDTLVPGNNGLKDQEMAIKWVHSNIHLFGGDNTKITIAGESAGGASVSFHLLNRKSDGLFRAAIMQSGTSINPFSLQRNARNNFFTLVSLINKAFDEKNGTEKVLQYLQTIPEEKLKVAAAQISRWPPVIELEHKGAFITKKMYSLIRNGNFIKVPILMGMTSEEALYNVADLESFRKRMELLDANLQQLLPIDMSLVLNDKNKTIFGKLIKEMYCQNGTFTDNLGAGIKYSSDNMLTRSIIKCAEMSSKFTNVFFYQFSYDGVMGNVSQNIDGVDNVAHGEELKYIWRITRAGYDNSNLDKFPDKDRLTQRRMLTLWTNFIKTTNPTPKRMIILQNVTWPTVSLGTTSDFLYLDINENLEIRNHPKAESYRRWLELYSMLEYDNFATF